MIKKDTLRWQFLTSTISTTMALLLLGALTLFVLTAKEIRNYVHQDLTITTILADSTSETTAQNLVVTLGEKFYVHKIQFISREQALQEQVEVLGINPHEFLGKNPFSISLEMKMKADYVCTDSLAWITEDLMQESAIVDVIYPEDVVETINQNLSTITYILILITVVLLVISISLINNTVHMGIYSQRFVINTMKIIGARWNFIRRPFMLRSLRIGLISAAIATLFLLVAVQWAIGIESSLAQFVPTRNVLIMVACIFAFAMVITLTCTFISVTHFLKMQERDLYR
ncbi:MAG: permease-like cell division protein FtsX [Bacteroidaceae bacterium]|nr:permease-like cell division protein FtsX [Bacteroidaceae bacterium]MBQ5694295.1 permease-like cell division protein FtsX [Bacteroidaceae bacterium]